MNPIINSIQNQQTQNLAQAYKQFASAGNPMNYFMSIAQCNPQLQPIVQMIRTGNSPESIARSMMQQRGINPDDFIRQIKGPTL